jgi:hypothetical protein
VHLRYIYQHMLGWARLNLEHKGQCVMICILHAIMYCPCGMLYDKYHTFELFVVCSHWAGACTKMEDMMYA